MAVAPRRAKKEGENFTNLASRLRQQPEFH
jgi:hypothetical protein